jgi:hypothetical protein
LVLEYMQALGKLSGPNKVTLVWIPGHEGILVNEEVDRLAKDRANKDAVGQAAGVPFAAGKKSHQQLLETGAPDQMGSLSQLPSFLGAEEIASAS